MLSLYRDTLNYSFLKVLKERPFRFRTWEINSINFISLNWYNASLKLRSVMYLMLNGL